MKLLFITTNNILDKICNGGAQCSRRNYSMVERIIGAENIDICMVADEKPGEINNRIYTVRRMQNRAALFIAGIFLYNTITPKEYKKLQNLILENQYDVVFADTTILGRTIKSIKKNCPQIKVIVFAHNLERDISWQRVQHENILCLTMFWAVRHSERLSLKYTDYFIALSERDGDKFWDYYERRPDMIIPITFEDRNNKNETNGSEGFREHSLLFVGSSYVPNRKGLEWFCQNVMPYVDATLYIVGKGIKEYCKVLESQNVVCIGEVENLQECYRSADAVVLPIIYGGGMKVKTAEAMMYGKRMFATSEALAGYRIDEKYMSRCDTAEDFVRSINHFFTKEKLQKEYASVREIYKTYYDTAVYERSMREVLCGSRGEK